MKKSTSSAAAFPAKMFHAPGLEKALKIAMGKLLAADYGGNMQGSLASLNQDMCWQKMFGAYCQPVLISNQEETSELFSGTWPTWGMMRNGIVTGLKPYKHRTKEKGCLLWPTAVASDGAQGAVIGKDDTFYTTSTGMPRKVNRNGTDGSVGLGRLVQMWRTPQAHNGQQGPKSKELYEKCLQTGQSMITLTDQVKNCNWPTPNVSDRHNANLNTGHDIGRNYLRAEVILQNWPTPRAREGNNGCKSCERNAGKFYLDGVVKQEEKIKGQLNADWVEILMGLPIGWTDIDKSNKEITPWPGWPAPMNGNQWGTHTASHSVRSERFMRGVLNPTEVIAKGIQANQYPYEPQRVVEGQKNRAKRLKCLGNGCVPLQVYPIFKAIMDAEKSYTDTK